jgi:hypothetical protein
MKIVAAMAHVEKGHGFGRLDPFISSSTVPMIQLPGLAGKADDEAINKVASSSARSRAEANSYKRTTLQSQCSRSGIPGNIHQVSNTPQILLSQPQLSANLRLKWVSAHQT